ncbi:hypothetical protein BD289DRAFT_417125 [Coniella lustricola]|uniref:Uncharacterized protein n=1 Tax=Coniella lustricola TaxID=2025994 RepID=A0A2T2ZVX1_9PEZI|nr:hypothetical protein BD289DRAFT_417125 [Coniella lustricola]
MALLNPAYGLIVPFLFVVTIPLAILAGITTTLAFTVLMFRVAVVYLDIAVNMVPQYITGHRIFPFPRAYATSVVIARQSSAVSNNNINNNNSNNTTTITKRADSVMIIPSIGMDRDFEGVGGWRLNGKDADDDDAWTQLNSRLELPLDTSRRQHHRSPSGGATTPGGGGGNSGTGGDYLMMKSPHAPRSKDASPDNTPGKRGRGERTGSSAVGTTMSPNSSRHRTPTASNVLGLSSSASSAAAVPPPLTARDRSDGSYFPLLSPKVARRAGSGGT